jgi:hypothetical protein
MPRALILLPPAGDQKSKPREVPSRRFEAKRKHARPPDDWIRLGGETPMKKVARRAACRGFYECAASASRATARPIRPGPARPSA